MPLRRIVGLCRPLLCLLVLLCGLLLVFAGPASPAYADGGGRNGDSDERGSQHGQGDDDDEGTGRGGSGIPEIDPGSAVTALAVLSGGLLLLTDRYRRRAARAPDSPPADA